MNARTEMEGPAEGGATGMDAVQDMVSESVHRLFGDRVTADARARFEARGDFDALWAACREAGLDRATAGESHGGIGMVLSETFALLHAVGWHAAPVPLAESLLAHALLAAAGIAPPDEGLVVPLDGAGASGPSRWRRHGAAQGHLQGGFRNVQWGGAAQWGVAMLDTPEGPWTALVDLRKGCDATVRAQMAHEPHADLRLEGAEIISVAAASAQHTSLTIRALGAMARCAQIVGALERVLALGVDYAGERVQFGKPIGQYQAVQQMLAAAAGQAAAARTATHVAFGQPQPRLFDIAVAKVRAGEAAGIAAATVHQVHGAIGFTAEHILHHYTQRLWSWRTEYGSDGHWARVLGQWAIAAGPQALWPALVERDMEQAQR